MNCFCFFNPPIDLLFELQQVIYYSFDNNAIDLSWIKHQRNRTCTSIFPNFSSGMKNLAKIEDLSANLCAALAGRH